MTKRKLFLILDLIAGTRRGYFLDDAEREMLNIITRHSYWANSAEIAEESDSIKQECVDMLAEILGNALNLPEG